MSFTIYEVERACIIHLHSSLFKRRVGSITTTPTNVWHHCWQMVPHHLSRPWGDFWCCLSFSLYAPPSSASEEHDPLMGMQYSSFLPSFIELAVSHLWEYIFYRLTVLFNEYSSNVSVVEMWSAVIWNHEALGSNPSGNRFFFFFLL